MAGGGDADPLLLPRSMEKFYKSHVEYNEILMTENKKIAEGFIQDFRAMMSENLRDLPLSVAGFEKQGSAFEGLKCGAPDEFDFAIQLKINKKKGDFEYVEGRNIGDSLPEGRMAAGYWKIQLKTTDKADEWKLFTDTWPDAAENKLCLSPRKVVQRIQSVIDKAFPNSGALPPAGQGAAGGQSAWRSQVKAIKRRTRGNPALTIELTKTDGSQIDVDVSPCLIDSQNKHFVPKRHPRLSGKPVSMNEPYEFLWMRTESQKELKAIAQIDQDGGERRKVMRVLKAALASKNTPFSQFHSSYVVKTAWLHVVKNNTSKEKWKGWEVLSLRLREILQFLEDSFKNKSLLSRFNNEENLLVKFNDPFLKSCHGYLQKLNNKLKSGKTTDFIHELGLDGSGTVRARDEL